MNGLFNASVFDSVSQQVALLLFHFLWQGFAIAAAIFITNRFLSLGSPTVRYVVAVLGLIAMPISVAITWVVLFSANPSTEVVPVLSAHELDALSVVTGPTNTAESGLPIAKSVMETWSPAVFVCYVIGAVLMIFRLVFSVFGIRRLRVSAKGDHALTDQLEPLLQKIGLRMRPKLKVCSRVMVPIAVGFIRPVIMLPASVATGLTPQEIDAILLHELAHIRRGDLLINWLQRVAEAMLFFHPSVWYVSRIISTERENCCDDVVLRHCNRNVYASALIRMAEICVGNAHGISELAASGASPSQLKRRVVRILGEGVTAPLFKPSLGVSLICLFAVSMTAVHLQAQSSKESAATYEASTRPLTMMADENGGVARFTASKGSLTRLADILQNLSKNPDVVIESTKIVRIDDRLTMTVTGKNLGFEVVGSAVPRTAVQPERRPSAQLDSETPEVLREKGSSKFLVQQFGDVRVVRGSHLNETNTKMIVAAVRRNMIDNKIDNKAADLVGSVFIESLGDSIILRGRNQDVDLLVRIIEGLEILSTGPNAGEMSRDGGRTSNRTESMQKRNANKRDEQSHAPVSNRSAELQAGWLLDLRKRDAEMEGQYGSDHPMRRSIERQIAAVEQLIEQIDTAKTPDSPRVSDAKETLTGPVRFESVGNATFGIRGAREDVERILSALEENPVCHAADRQLSNDQNLDVSNSFLTGPVRLKFFGSGSDTFVVRGRKEDVDQVLQLIHRKQDRGTVSNPKSDVDSKVPSQPGRVPPQEESNTGSKPGNGKTAEGAADTRVEIPERQIDLPKRPTRPKTLRVYELGHASAQHVADTVNSRLAGKVGEEIATADVAMNRLIVISDSSNAAQIASILNRFGIVSTSPSQRNVRSREEISVIVGGLSTGWSANDRNRDLRFPVQVERAMMGDAANRAVPASSAFPGQTVQPALRFSEEVESGMMLDAQDQQNIR